MGKQLGRVDIRGSKTEHETRDYQNKTGNTKMKTKTWNEMRTGSTGKQRKETQKRKHGNSQGKRGMEGESE